MILELRRKTLGLSIIAVLLYTTSSVAWDREITVVNKISNHTGLFWIEHVYRDVALGSCAEKILSTDMSYKFIMTDCKGDPVRVALYKPGSNKSVEWSCTPTIPPGNGAHVIVKSTGCDTQLFPKRP